MSSGRNSRSSARCNRTGGGWWQDKIICSSSSSSCSSSSYCSCLDTQDAHTGAVSLMEVWTRAFNSQALLGDTCDPVTALVDLDLEAILSPTRAVDLPNQGTGWVVTSKSDLPVFVPQSSDYLLLHGERVNSGDWRQQRHHLVGLCHLINIGQKRNKGFR